MATRHTERLWRHSEGSQSPSESPRRSRRVSRVERHGTLASLCGVNGGRYCTTSTIGGAATKVGQANSHDGLAERNGKQAMAVRLDKG